MWMIFFLKFHETHTIWLNSHPACILNFYNLRFYFWNICVSTNLTQTIKCFISRIYFSRLLFTLFGELKAGWSFNVRLNNSFNIDSFHLALVVSVVKSFLDPVLTWACLGSPRGDVRSWHPRAKTPLQVKWKPGRHRSAQSRAGPIWISLISTKRVAALSQAKTSHTKSWNRYKPWYINFSC